MFKKIFQLPFIEQNKMTNCITLCFLFLVILFPVKSFTLAKSETYIIHMDLSVMPKVFSSHKNWFLTTLAASVSDSSSSNIDSISSSKLVYAYTNSIHGFSARLSVSELEVVKNSPGYLSSSKDMTVKIDTTHTSQFLGLSSNSGAWLKSDYGKDVIVGLVDTGIWPESKSFDDNGMTDVPSRWKGECESGTHFSSSLCNKKLIGARYFNKGLIASKPNVTISMNSARDTDGHGTHTSSTATGSRVESVSYFGYAPGTSTGMAPKAHVAMYKALWDEGSMVSDILAAIDQAIEDGVDVMSLSLGIDDRPLYDDPIAIASFAAMEKGIFVSTSAGNEGPDDETLHNGTPWVLTVAAGTVDREFLGRLTLGNGVSVTGLSLYPGNSSSSESSIAFGNTCLEKELQQNTHKIAVCYDTNGSISDQVYNVRNSRVAGAVFITNYTDLEFYLQSEFPAVFLNIQDGEKVLQYIKNSPLPKAKLEFQVTHLGVKPAPQVASYSSRGPSPSCPAILKPDLMAPGALILASWAQQSPVTGINSGELFSNFNIISGTSMACPHAAGVAALLKGVHPDWSPAAIRSAMMTTSDMLDNTQSPIRDTGSPNNNAANPLAMGAGHINPNKALDPGLIYDMTSQDYTNLLCALNFTSQQIKTITRSAYSCSTPSLDLNYPSFIGFFNWNSSKSDPKRIQEFKRTMTNLGDHGMSIYTAKVTTLEGYKVSVTPNKLVFKKKYEKQSYKLMIEGPLLVEKYVVYGSLSWVETSGKYVVRSPIVATTIRMDPL